MLAGLAFVATGPTPAPATGELACLKLGSWTDAPQAEAADLFENPRGHAGQRLRTTGTLYVLFEAPGLCHALEERTPEAERKCIVVGFDWQRLGDERKHVYRVLEQWNGRIVRIEGELSPTGPPWLLKNVNGVELLENLASVPESYCVGYRGPRPTGLLLRPEVPRNGTRRGGRRVASGAVVYLDATNLAVQILRGAYPNVEASTAPLSLPQPFRSGWDIWAFQPISESVWVAVMVDDGLYGWKNGVVRKLEEADVGRIARSGENVLYQLRRFRGKDLAWSALRRVNAEFELETLWESDTMELTGWLPPRQGQIPERIFVRRDFRLGDVRLGEVDYDAARRQWQPVRWTVPRPDPAESPSPEQAGRD